RRPAGVALDAVRVRASPAQALVVLHAEVRRREVDDRRLVPRRRVVDRRVLGRGALHAGLSSAAIAVAPAEAVDVPGAVAAAHVVDLELGGALVHVPEELEDRRVGRRAAEDLSRLPDAGDRAGLIRLDE